MARAVLNIIEPTLADQTGHCHGYVRSLLRASNHDKFEFHVWLDRRGKGLFQEEKCCVHPYFFRQLRKIQSYFCLRKLLRSKNSIFIPTAGRMDLNYLHHLLRHRQDYSPVFLHFHQFTETPAKMMQLKKIAKALPSVVVMTPTKQLSAIFKRAGFLKCESIPCPGYESRPSTMTRPAEFKKIIYAGAARVDKGFPHVVGFIEYLSAQKISLPVELQISPPHSGRYDEASEKAIAWLRQCTQLQLTLHEKTLEQEAYQQLFEQAIALLLYDPDHYHAKFSGVALDSFSAGCPVITVPHTWAGEMVERFQAGIVMKDRAPNTVYEAVRLIQQDYSRFHNNAKRAGQVLQQEHDPANTLAMLEKYMEHQS